MNITALTLKQSGGIDIKKGPECPYCPPGTFAVLVNCNDHYHRNNIEGNMWVCNGCQASVGTHKRGDWMNYPLGRLAGNELKTLKQNAHTLFDAIWKSGKMNRSEAYIWLQKTMGVTEPYGHIGEMDEATCATFIQKLNEYYSK